MTLYHVAAILYRGGAVVPIAGSRDRSQMGKRAIERIIGSAAERVPCI